LKVTGFEAVEVVCREDRVGVHGGVNNPRSRLL
jgi:hypothetical protein